MSRSRRSRARRSQQATSPPAPLAAPLPRVRLAPAVLAGASVAAATAGLGMPADNVMQPAGVSAVSLIATPVAIALAGAAALALLWHRRERVACTPAVLGFGVLVLWAALSVALGRYAQAGLHALATLVACVAVGGVVASQADSRVRAWLAISVAATATLVAAVGVREWVQYRADGIPDWRVFGPFASPNFLAGYLAPTALLTAGLAVGARDRLTALSLSFACVLQVACLLLTQSRAGLAATSLGVLVLAISLWRAGLWGRASLRRAAMLAAALTAIGFAMAQPAATRVGAAGGEGHSMAFRIMTWHGTQRMADARPIVGWGLGSFEQVFPRFAITGYTQHAHNAYVQLTAETGYPGALAFLIGLAAVLATVTTGLRGRRDPEPSPDETQAPGSRNGHVSALGLEVGPVQAGAIAAGCLAALLAAIVRNLADSDLSVPSVALMFALVCGLAAGARPASAAPAPMVRLAPVRAGALALGVCLWLWAGSTSLARLEMATAQGAFAEMRGADAARALERASSFAPLDPEPRLRLAMLMEGARQPERARAAYEDAVRLAPSVRPLRRYARFLRRQGDLSAAIAAHERARRADPHNLQNLLALAECYKEAGRPAHAVAVYRTMVSLHEGVHGQVRALPEIVNWESGLAYAAVADAELAAGRREEAERLYAEAAEILGEFWRTRNDVRVLALGLPPEVRAQAADGYHEALAKRASVLRELGRADVAREAEAELDAFRAERQRDSAGSSAPGG
ncbi:MAG TPA: O-antigen ligase family protein [Chthonomonadales bacterium]|nr:O-antigen ligase family protein [Chthonomonadales bacterium]